MNSLISTVPPNDQMVLDPSNSSKIRKQSISLPIINKLIYLSATSVYGDGIVNEKTKPDPKIKEV